MHDYAILTNHPLVPASFPKTVLILKSAGKPQRSTRPQTHHPLTMQIHVASFLHD
jgi:hypothetical protein